MRSLSVLAAALLVLALCTGVSTGVPSGAHASTSAAPSAGFATQPSFEPADPATVIEINVTRSGDAHVSVSYRYVLEGENETTAFRQYGRAVSKGQEQVPFSAELFQQFASQASTWTGREMRIQDTSWQSPVVDDPVSTATTTTTATATATATDDTEETRIGVLTYTFTWTNFAEKRGNEVVVRDVFGTENETWFPKLYDGQRLVINEPENYAIIDSPADKGPQNSSLIWDGPETFPPGYIEAVYVPRVDPTPPTTTGTTPPGPNEEGGFPFAILGFGLLVVLVGAGSYLFARWQTERETSGPTPTPNGGHQTATVDDATTETAALDEDTESVTTDHGAGDGAETPTETAEEAVSDDEATKEEADDDIDPIDVELLSDEERVLRLLRGNNGRMKQANIVKETGWSNAKVSQLLSGMDDDGEIEKLRIGRENLITLPGESIGDFDDS
ncbi:helix-turn-helix transcriptional regulator [Haloarchaeobius sp. DT45]|uniref:helix-turn-helix transcriptional regulator n=1 Tax=Haloarchaeobius sp. DT45 TaxID=3446116 RepID=UPI003F6D90B5